ncbi:MAG TPA: amino-acid N-acetyltransferase [Oceanospirillales bacterium]|nr:amino-acid N-acetyltransferase [Oceanospirillaceae bacterium]HBS42347.1 amino-acid N-acetyltransferase [Oceanospirillales bacterium]
MNDTTTSYVQWFRQSSPYINAHRDKTVVIMFDGDALLHDNFTRIVQDIALLNSLDVRMVLVHGARPQIDAVLERLDITSQFHDGLRITDAEALRAVKAAVGMVKADIESLLSVGIPGTAMHGSRIRVVSGNFVTAKPLGVIDGVDYQHTGEVRRIDHQAITHLLDQYNVVLLSCSGYSPSGEMFNLSLEDVAYHAAVSLRADKVIAFGPDDGLYTPEGDPLKELTCRQLEARMSDFTDETDLLQASMAVRCVRQGVPRVHLISYQTDGALLQELYTREGKGTLVSQEAYDQLRPAGIDDVAGILELLAPLEEQGILVRRSRELLETEIHRFHVIERDGLITACAALYPYSSDMAELACVAVHTSYRGTNRGQRLLEQIEEEARRRNINKLFVLTTRTAHWFIEHGFVAAQISELPPEKQKMYNYQRNSKVFFKSL